MFLRSRLSPRAALYLCTVSIASAGFPKFSSPKVLGLCQCKHSEPSCAVHAIHMNLTTPPGDQDPCFQVLYLGGSRNVVLANLSFVFRSCAAGTCAAAVEEWILCTFP